MINSFEEYPQGFSMNNYLMRERISLGQKIKVFISSICGVAKYDKVRTDLKNAIESTQLADVYTFEGKGASTLPAGVHYTLALEDSDICIFLIDNADGINPGVQTEIDTVKKYRIWHCRVQEIRIQDSFSIW